MGRLFQVSVVLILSLSYVVNGDLFSEFLSPEKENILFHLGSKLKLLGIPEMKITEDPHRTGGSWFIGYGNNQYFRMNFTRPRRYKFLSAIDFNIQNFKGTFRRKGSETMINGNGQWQLGSRSCAWASSTGSIDRSGFKCNDGNCIDNSKLCNGHRDCPQNEDEEICGINMDNPFDADDNPLELEGTLVNEDSTVCSPYHPNHCFDNATMLIKILPDREHLGLELSLTSSFKSNFRSDFFPKGPAPMYSFLEDLKKFEISLNMLIPRRPQPGNIKVDLSLKLKSDISERLQSGEEKKPAVYTFSVSTKLTKLGISRIQNSYQESTFAEYYNVAVKANVKETVEFEDNTLTYKNWFKDLMDKTLSFDGNIFIRTNINSLEYGIKILDFKFIDVDEDVGLANLQYLVYKDHFRLELDAFDRNNFFGASKISLNAKWHMNESYEYLKIYFETNEIGMNVNDACNAKYKALIGNNSIKAQASMAENDANECNKYMIYEGQQYLKDAGPGGHYKMVYKTTIQYYVEPMFFFGRWFRPVMNLKRRDRSLMFKEETKLYNEQNNRTLHIHTTFAIPKGNIYHLKQFGAVEVFTQIQSDIYEKATIRSDVTILNVLPSLSGNRSRSPLGFLDLSFDSNMKTCSAKLVNVIDIARIDGTIGSIEDKFVDGTLFDCDSWLARFSLYDDWIIYINDSMFNYTEMSLLSMMRAILGDIKPQPQPHYAYPPPPPPPQPAPRHFDQTKDDEKTQI